MTIHRTIYEKSVFVDTGAFVALIDGDDPKHAIAKSCIENIRSQKYPIFVSNVTIIETHKRVLFDLGYKQAFAFLVDIYSGRFNILRLTKEDEYEAKRIIEVFSDQSFTFADAINFSLMKRKGILKAFAFDKHYSIFGFEKIPLIY